VAVVGQACAVGFTFPGHENMPFNHRDDGVRTKTRWHELLKAIARLATTQSGKKKVFISYAWNEGDKTTDENIRLHRWLSQLQDDLELCGFQVFLDLSDMHGMMLDKMQSEVEASDGALIICTPRLKERSTVLDSNLVFKLFAHHVWRKDVRMKIPM
jgi:hypothetical protein